jgi:hypothetical protein
MPVNNVEIAFHKGAKTVPAKVMIGLAVVQFFFPFREDVALCQIVFSSQSPFVDVLEVLWKILKDCQFGHWFRIDVLFENLLITKGFVY